LLSSLLALSALTSFLASVFVWLLPSVFEPLPLPGTNSAVAALGATLALVAERGAEIAGPVVAAGAATAPGAALPGAVLIEGTSVICA
jgi:multisubunit Na+/H+ antiporter MnhG subunit